MMRNDSELLKFYHQQLAKLGYQADPAQELAMVQLQQLLKQLLSYQQQSFFQRLFSPLRSPNSLYFWSRIGRGKRFMMGFFFNFAPIAKKQRIHFHAFM